ncbi:MAG: hypothetical protein E6I94_05955 [Chloroflexi bacterium]|nr:MAG: hypothetical protein E6I94_05955 [Chloroflexota bacterium]
MTIEDRALQIRCFPAEDSVFSFDVQRIVAESRETIAAGERLMRRVQEQLSQHYPAVTIRRRDELAEVYEPDSEVWYVFRDGRVA